MNTLKSIISFSFIFLSQILIAQENAIIPDLTKIVTGEGWQVINREAKIIEENGQQIIQFKATNQQGGVAWLEDLEFTNGVIEVDIKGKNVKGGSFVGVA